MKKILGSVALVAALTSSAFAAGNSNSGCGLGSIVIKNQDSTLMQVLAVTTNGTSSNQTFGITSGTSNCDKPSKFVSNDKINIFVADNMDVLAMDIAQGQGESLETLATLLKVEDKATFATKLQANFDKIYTNEAVSSAQVIDNIVTIAS